MVLIFYQLFQNTWYIQKTNGSHLLSVISEYLIHTKNKWFSSSISYFRILCKYKKNKWFSSSISYFRILCKYKKNKWFSSSISYFRILGTYKKQMVLIFYQLFQNTWYIQKTNGSHLLVAHHIIFDFYKMKNKKYHTVGTVLKYHTVGTVPNPIQKLYKEAKLIPLTHMTSQFPAMV